MNTRQGWRGVGWAGVCVGMWGAGSISWAVALRTKVARLRCPEGRHPRAALACRLVREGVARHSARSWVAVRSGQWSILSKRVYF